MFYHDHAYGITRLNVYAGEAAGYLLTDPEEDSLIDIGIIPGQCRRTHRYGIPLIIQDKTFVPQNIATQDAKWDTHQLGAIRAISGSPMSMSRTRTRLGLDGANPRPLGLRSLVLAAVIRALPLPGQLRDSPDRHRLRRARSLHGHPAGQRHRLPYLNGGAQGLPVPDPECLQRPESQPAACIMPTRPTRRRVKMVPAVPDTPAFPPTWPTDGRDGGVPDPTTVGPAMIQIGTEGGFLPAPVVIPNHAGRL